MSLDKIKAAAEAHAKKKDSIGGVEEKSTNKELVINTLANLDISTIFDDESTLDEVLPKIEAEVRSIVLDPTTDKGRKAIGSLAAKVSKSKTAIEAAKKAKTEQWKVKSKAVDAIGKAADDRLAALRDEILLPRKQWQEAEDKRIAEEAAREEAEKIQVEIDRDHEMGLLLNNEFDRQAEAAAKEKQDAERIEAERIETERIEREATIAAKAEQKAKDEATKAIQDAKDAAEKAERDRIATEERAKLEREQALKREQDAKDKAEQDAIDARAKAEAEKKAAVKAEQDRVERENLAGEEATRKREADAEHYKQVMGAAKIDLITLGFTEEIAVQVLKAVKAGKVSNVSIKF